MPSSQDLYSIWHILNITNIYHPPPHPLGHVVNLKSAGCFVLVLEMVIVLVVICCEVYNPICVLGLYLCPFLTHSLRAAMNTKRPQ